MRCLICCILLLLALSSRARAEETLRWIRDGHPTPQALALIDILRDAEAKGLDANEYDGPVWAGRLDALARAPGEPAAFTRFDAALTEAAFRYSSDLTRGRIDPRSVGWQLDRSSAPLDRDQILGTLALTPDVATELNALETQLPIYRRTLQMLRVYLDLARRDVGEPLPAWKRTIVEGDEWEGLATLVQRLVLVGDLAADTPVPSRYEGAVVDAVKRFQQRHGLIPDGEIDRRCARALAVSMRARATQLAFSLERLRWLPRDLAPPLIVVNIPEFRLRAIESSAPPLSMKVVVGRAYHHRTPVFVGSLSSVLFHPPWTVPTDIARKELVPEFTAHPEKMETQNFELIDSSESVIPSSPEALAKAASGQLRLRQRAGPHSALGGIKLDLPNRNGIYLHDTPSLGGFAKERRDFSHGCIRLENALALARWALRSTPEWPTERIDEAVEGEETLRATLAKAIPVLILYNTAIVTESGDAQFFEDLYRADARLARALAGAGHPAPAP